MITITNTLRNAAKTCGITQQELARTSGVQESVVSRFLAGAGLRSGNMDALAKTLGLELTPIKAGKAATTTSKSTSKKTTKPAKATRGGK